MKKLLLFATVFLAISTNAQKKFTEYSLSYWTDKTTYNIEVSNNGNELEKIYIDVHTLDTLQKEGSINISKKRLPDFITFLNECKSKYVEWSKTAKANNVTDLNKAIETEKKFTSDVAFRYGKWQFTSARISPKFILDKKGIFLALTTGELQSSSNQFMKMDGLALVFSSEDEISDFIGKLNLVEIENFIKDNSDKKDLFK